MKFSNEGGGNEEGVEVDPTKEVSLRKYEWLPQLSGLVVTNQFFVIHAARQPGKTTLLKALAQDLNAKGTQVTLYRSLEMGQGIPAAKLGF